MGFWRLQLYGEGKSNPPLILDVMIPIDVKYVQSLGIAIGDKIIEGFELKQTITKIPNTNESKHE